jgi:hypothetical protein
MVVTIPTLLALNSHHNILSAIVIIGSEGSAMGIMAAVLIYTCWMFPGHPSRSQSLVKQLSSLRWRRLKERHSTISNSRTLLSLSVIDGHLQLAVALYQHWLSSSNNTFAALLQQRQLSEEFEMRQRRLEREEERQRREEERARREEERLRREEEVHEMRRKESRQQEERSMLFQLAMTGLIAYLGIKKKEDDDGKPHAS